MRTLLCILVLAFSGIAIADDVSATGKWSGSFKISHANGETEDSTAILVLKQTGTEITGTVGPNEDKQLPIQKGKIEGAKITLEADNQGARLNSLSYYRVTTLREKRACRRTMAGLARPSSM